MTEAKTEHGMVMAGAETFRLPGGEAGCLLIHGITSSPQQMRLMGEHLARNGIAATGVRLAGHGTRIEDLHRVSYEDWVKSAETELLRLKESCRYLFCAGLSLGGILSLRLARLHPDLVSGVITICSSYDLKGFLFRLVPLLHGAIRKISTGSPAICDPNAKEIKYSHHSVPAVNQLLKLSAVVRSDISEITCPVVIFGGRKDDVIGKDDPLIYYNKIGSQDKELIWLDNSHHVATLDYDKTIIFEKSAAFIKRLSK